MPSPTDVTGLFGQAPPAPPAVPAALDGPLALLMPGVSPFHLASGLVGAALLSAFMAWVYKVSAEDTYDADIAQAQILLACIMALVLMVVGDSVSRAFGAVGILSVIRFRSNVKNSAEAATLLAAVAVGMACGVGLIGVALAGALFLSLMQLVLRRVFAVPPEAVEPVKEKKKKKDKKKDDEPAPADDDVLDVEAEPAA